PEELGVAGGERQRAPARGERPPWARRVGVAAADVVGDAPQGREVAGEARVADVRGGAWGRARARGYRDDGEEKQQHAHGGRKLAGAIRWCQTHRHPVPSPAWPPRARVFTGIARSSGSWPRTARRWR